MKISLKLFISVGLILTLALSSFCAVTVALNYNFSIQQAYDDALLELRTLRMSLQIAIHDDGEDAALSSLSNQLWVVSYAKKMALLDDKGNILFSDNVEWIDDTLKDASWPDSMNDTIELSRGKYVGFYEFTARSRFAVGDSYYSLILIQSADAIMTRLQDQLRVFQIIYIFMMIAALLFIFAFSGVFTKSIRRLTLATARLADGALDERIEIITSDEIGQLSKAFNSMAQSIQDNMEKLKLESSNKDVFVANFAHEIKTPMTSILGYADTIYQTESISPEVRSASEYILNEGLRLELLSHKLMELYVLDKQDFIFVETSLSEFLYELRLSMLPTLTERNVSIILDTEQSYVRIEPDLFASMFNNLIDNAMKAGATQIEVQGRWRHSEYQICIRDNGGGMDATEIEHIKEAFYMVDKSRARAQHGAGLGLALCEKIAQLHKTTLQFVSVKGTGTTVSFSLRGEDKNANE